MIFFLFALLAGVVTIAGPCILPLLPIILGTSAVKAHVSRPLFIVLGFTLSFSVFAVLFGIFGNILGIRPETFRTLAAIVIGCFGLLMIVPGLQERLFMKLQPFISGVTPRIHQDDGGLWGGFLLGTSLGLVWSPCAGPILGSILTLIASRQNAPQAASLLFAYALGASAPMLGIAYGGRAAVARVRVFAAYAETLQRVFGVLIVLVAIGMYTGMDRDIQAYLVTNAPWLFPNLSLNL